MQSSNTPGFVASEQSVQEEPCFCILHYPRQSLFQILSCHSTATKDVPSMSSNLFELECLQSGVSLSAFTELGNLKDPEMKRETQHRFDTSRISWPSMHPVTSVLLANTSRLAPESRWQEHQLLSYDGKHLRDRKPLPAGDHGARSCNRRSSTDQSRRRPISRRLSSQNNSASMSEGSSGRQHPLSSGERFAQVVWRQQDCLSSIHMFNLYLEGR